MMLAAAHLHVHSTFCTLVECKMWNEHVIVRPSGPWMVTILPMCVGDGMCRDWTSHFCFHTLANDSRVFYENNIQNTGAVCTDWPHSGMAFYNFATSSRNCHSPAYLRCSSRFGCLGRTEHNYWVADLFFIMWKATKLTTTCKTSFFSEHVLWFIREIY